MVGFLVLLKQCPRRRSLLSLSSSTTPGAGRHGCGHRVWKATSNSGNLGRYTESYYSVQQIFVTTCHLLGTVRTPEEVLLEMIDVTSTNKTYLSLQGEVGDVRF
jgi:hypothetical protein